MAEVEVDSSHYGSRAAASDKDDISLPWQGYRGQNILSGRSRQTDIDWIENSTFSRRKKSRVLPSTIHINTQENGQEEFPRSRREPAKETEGCPRGSDE